jgi:hypothetical protein
MNTKPDYISLGRLAPLKWSARALARESSCKALRFDLMCYYRAYLKIDMYFFCN